jgi:hypothetical protein
VDVRLGQFTKEQVEFTLGRMVRYVGRRYVGGQSKPCPYGRKTSARRYVSDSRRQTILPLTIVAIGAPWNLRPSNGVLRDLLADSAARKIHS